MVISRGDGSEKQMIANGSHTSILIVGIRSSKQQGSFAVERLMLFSTRKDHGNIAPRLLLGNKQKKKKNLPSSTPRDIMYL
jgi:hypothetical protein